MPPRPSVARASRVPGRVQPDSRETPREAISYDWLRLTGIQAYGHLGVTSREQELGQRVEVDVEVAYAPSPRRRPDALSERVDYEELGRLVRSKIEASRCKLIESLAEEIAGHVLAAFEAPKVRIRLRKLHVPVSGFSGIPEIEIERSRP